MTESGNYIAEGDFLLSLIPQKTPFVMVDSLAEYSEKHIVSAYTVKSDNILVSENRFSASGLIENMAQTVALHTGYKYYLLDRPAPTGYIGAIKKAEVFELPEVSQKLITTVHILHDIMGVTLVRAEVTSEGILITSSEMKTALAQ
ncbi:putative hotdog family 3-hydroxylacyl-ACP dehydratase [Flavobacteriaceae bacterium MAR_2009_75]|nr:putative hotdog family 3-hydroxylacyl-ACP dehydratase [Flavobacteriaceae bacterium MAR_2009_75]